MNIQQMSGTPEMTPPIQPQQSNMLDMLLFSLRFCFYLVVVIRFVRLTYYRKRKQSIKERISRKYCHAFLEIIKYYTEQDKKVMEVTLNNTYLNTQIEYISSTKTHKKTNKSVNFLISRNIYYQPKEEEYIDVAEGKQSTVVQQNQSNQDDSQWPLKCTYSRQLGDREVIEVQGNSSAQVNRAQVNGAQVNDDAHLNEHTKQPTYSVSNSDSTQDEESNLLKEEEVSSIQCH